MTFSRSFLLAFISCLIACLPQLAQAQFGIVLPSQSYTQEEKEVQIRRCYASEMDSALRAKFPEMGDEADFEQWMNRAQRHAPATRSVNTLPVIVHILHDGSAAGAGYNLDAARIQSQIDILNLDFRRLNADTTQTPSQYHSVASDLQIEFKLATVDPNGLPLAEPGINRIDKVAQGWTAGSVTPSYVNSTIKPETQWDPNLYINIWVVPLAGNKLGTAQFPQQSGLPGLNYFNAAETDGIIITTNAFGANPNFVPYHLGRTATHEMGHFLGLRHIWGDGGCGFDDYCADTPESDQSHSGCQKGVQSCGDRDMVENFMDYSDDGCMNLFTADQKARVNTVLQMSPRRATLVSSDRAMPLGPDLYFSSGTLEVQEAAADSSTCGSFVDITLTVMLARPTTTGGSAELQVQGGNATLGEDFDFPQGTIVSFAPGQSTPETLTLRLFDDGYFEGVEKLPLKLDLVGGGTSDLMLLPEHDSVLLSLVDNELNPSQDLLNVLLSENFESSNGALPAGWQITNNLGGSNSWTVSGSNALQGNHSAHISDGSGGYTYNKTSASQSYLLTPPLQTTNTAQLTLDFDYKVEGELYFNTVYDYGQVYLTTDGTTFTPLTERLYDLADTVHHMTLTLPDTLQSKTFQLAFGWANDHMVGFDPPFTIDNVTVVAGRGEVANNLGATREHYLGPYDMVHFFDDTTGRLLATVHNLSSYDYGCTSIQIDRSGLGTTPFLDANSPETGLMTKTFRIVPTHTPAGNQGRYRVTLYYTADEVNSYESATGQTWSDASIIKTNGAIADVDASAPLLAGEIHTGPALLASQLNYAYAMMAEFTGGMGGLGVGQPDNFNRTTFPIDYVDFEVWEEATHAQIAWNFTTDNGVNHFGVERSTDGIHFENIAVITPQGNEANGHYAFTDSNVVELSRSSIFYRVRGLDINGGEYLTEVRSITARARGVALKAYPVPFTDELNLEIDQPRMRGEVEVTVHDLTGRELYRTQRNLSQGSSHWTLPLSRLSPGVYLVQARSGQEVAQKRVIKR